MLSLVKSQHFFLKAQSPKGSHELNLPTMVCSAWGDHIKDLSTVKRYFLSEQCPSKSFYFSSGLKRSSYKHVIQKKGKKGSAL